MNPKRHAQTVTFTPKRLCQTVTFGQNVTVQTGRLSVNPSYLSVRLKRLDRKPSLRRQP